jgi:hypothetical protein
MSEAEVPYCDECGRVMKKIFRRYRGIRYCAACYTRLFKKRLCPKCGNLARLFVKDPKAICLSCERNAPCIRCGREGRPLGKMTPDGPVCNSCYSWFREEKPCAFCGTLSKRLSSYPSIGIDVLICENCASPLLGKGTCQACHRHRKLHDAPDGRRLCRRCLEEEDSPCTVCGKMIPAGRNGKCEECGFREGFLRRVAFNRAAFATERFASLYEEFGKWLDAEVGAHKAFLWINKFLSFFTEMENLWKDIPPYEDLLSHFGAEGLRRVRLPMRWLRDTRGITADSRIRERDSERRRIEALLSTFPEGMANILLKDYGEFLLDKMARDKLKIRSLRFALSTAAGFLRSMERDGLPEQEDVNGYLLEKPGQRSSLSGFIHFVNKKHSLYLEVLVDYDRVERARKRRAERKMLSLMRNPPGEGSSRKDYENFENDWVLAGLAYFHGVGAGTAKKEILKNTSVNADGSFTVGMQGRKYWVPGCRDM